MNDLVALGPLLKVETKEAIPLYFGRTDPMMEKLQEKVQTISDEMRSKAPLLKTSLHNDPRLIQKL